MICERRSPHTSLRDSDRFLHDDGHVLGEEALDLIGIADELERRALTHEKVISQLDLPRARHLRDLASRIRRVVDTSEGDGDRDAVHGEVVGLRLEAMCSLLEEPVQAPPVSLRSPVPRPGAEEPKSEPRVAPSGWSGQSAGPAPTLAEAAIPIGRVRRRG